MNKLSINIIKLLIFLFPLTILIYGKAPGVIFNILFVIGVCFIIYDLVNNNNVSFFLKKYYLLVIVFSLPIVLDTLSKIIASNYDDLFATSLQRILFIPIIVYLLDRMKFNKIYYLDYGIILASFLSLFLYMKYSNYGAYRPDIEIHNLLNYTNIIVIFFAYLLYSLFSQNIKNIYLNVFIRICAIVCCFGSIVLSQSKGPLLSAVILLLLFIIRYLKDKSYIIKFSVVSFVIIMTILFAFNSNQFKDRFYYGFNAVTSIDKILNDELPEGTDRSTRVRINLWKASVMMSLDNILLGDGKYNFSEKLIRLNSQGLINDESTWASKDRPFNQAHNEFFHMFSKLGIIGVLTLFAIYIIPFVYFKNKKYPQDNMYTAREIGYSYSLAIILFGLTVTIFTATWMTAIYGVFLSIYLTE